MPAMALNEMPLPVLPCFLPLALFSVETAIGAFPIPQFFEYSRQDSLYESGVVRGKRDLENQSQLIVRPEHAPEALTVFS
ncbi:hypothetical protein D9M72_603350 [compost metagenome]